MSFKGEKLTEVDNKETKETKKTKQKKNDKNKEVDSSRYDEPGMNFKAKIIGHERVNDKKGEKMCQVSMAKLKAGAIALGEHKEKVVINLSHAGVKIYDEKQEQVLQHHVVRHISFVSRDVSDSRAFGYIFDMRLKPEDESKFEFWAYKTEKAAEPLMQCLRELFTVTVEGGGALAESAEAADTAKLEAAEQLEDKAAASSDLMSASEEVVVTKPHSLISVEHDILGLSLASSDQQTQHQQQPQPQPQQPHRPQPQQPVQHHQQFSPAVTYTNTTHHHHQVNSPPIYPYIPPPYNNQHYYPVQGGAQYAQYNQMGNPFQPPHTYSQPPYPPQNPVLQQYPQLNKPAVPQRQWKPFEHQTSQPSNPFSTPPVHHAPVPSNLRPTASQPDFADLSIEEDFGDDFIDSLTNITKAPAYPNGRLVTKEDFNKEPPTKPSLLALANQQKMNQPPPHPASLPQPGSIPYHQPRTSIRKDSIGLEMNSEKSSSGSEHSRSMAEEQGRLMDEALIRPRPIPAEQLKSVAQLALTKNIKASHRPVTIDMSAMRYSPFEDKKGLSESTIVDWQGSPSTKPPPLEPVNNWNYKK